MTPEQTLGLRQAQTRTFDAPLDLVFRVTTAYLQDNFYQIRQASKESGIINATKAQDLSGGAKFMGAMFAGGSAKKGDTFDVTISFEAVDTRTTQIRCNITHGQNNLMGGQMDVQPVTDLDKYKNLLDGLSVEVHRRALAADLRQAPEAQAPKP